MSADPFERRPAAVEITPKSRLAARVAGVYVAPGNDFQTRPATELRVDLEGIEGDFHRGLARRSGSREPWYERGTEMRNERQVSIVAPDELAEIARAMGLAEIRPEWIGANLLVEGVPSLSMLPSGTLLFFANGATLKVDGQNAPCRFAGAAVAENAGSADRDAAALEFPKAARRLRGLVAWVEKPGAIVDGEDIRVQIPEQWIYRP